LDASIASKMKDARLRNQLVSAYSTFLEELAESGEAQGVQPKALRTYMKEAAQVRNRKLKDLFRGDKLLDRVYGMAGDFEHDKDQAKLQGEVDRLIENNIRNFDDEGPLRLVIHESQDRIHGITLRKIYDAKQGQYSYVLKIANPKFGKTVRYRSSSGELAVMIGKPSGAEEKFEFPFSRILRGHELEILGRDGTVRARYRIPEGEPGCLADVLKSMVSND
jgi:hypothetical protein